MTWSSTGNTPVAVSAGGGLREVMSLKDPAALTAAEMVNKTAARDLVQRRHRFGMLGVLRPPFEELLEGLAEDLPPSAGPA
ncbi:hypothetical protein [Streptomyces peucetius]|nr:hypothetical protein CGZ69_00080 [Streptomyces peucetius subsp. caesius ATCC 27952]